MTGCALLHPSTPPPAINPCTGSKVDIQTATTSRLQSAFGLSSNTARNLVDARPYNSLNQIRPERVPGLGASSQALVARNGCLTPATITTATATYRWAYNDTTTRAQRASFSLTVPAGSISSTPGAWPSVTDAVATELLTGPTAVLAEADWERLGPLLPSSDGVRGRPFRDHRQVLEGILFRYRTGCAWRDLPPEFGPWQTVWKRHHRFSLDGTWDRILTALQTQADAAGELDWRVSVDSSISRVHQHGATAAREPTGSTRGLEGTT